MPAGKGLRSGLVGCPRVGAIRIPGIVVGNLGNDLRSPFRGWGKHAVIADEMKAGWGEAPSLSGLCPEPRLLRLHGKTAVRRFVARREFFNQLEGL